MLITGFLITIMKDYKKYYTLNASPEVVYNALTNAATIQLWSGESAVMEPVAGTEFSLWEDSIVGKNLEFIPGKKIVQEWYFGEQEAESIVTIKLHPHKHGTSAELTHTNIPDEAFYEMVEGWDNNYFGLLIAFYE